MADSQGNPTEREFFHLTEEWWGEAFSPKLVTSISTAPKSHLVAYIESMEDQIGFDDSPVPKGAIRPALGVSQRDPTAEVQVQTALQLLLYSHEVVLEPRVLRPLDAGYGQRKLLATRLNLMLRLRPLIEDGTIRCQIVQSRGRHPAFEELRLQILSRTDHLEEVIPLDENGAILDYRSFVDNAGAIFGGMALSKANLAQPLARTSLDAHLLRGFLDVGFKDRRQSTLALLAGMHLPSMSGQIENIVRLRQSSEAFAEWRSHLSAALGTVDTMGSDVSIEDAKQIVVHELREGIAGIDRSVKSSPALAAMKGGLVGFSVSAVSAATTGIITGNPWNALAAGVAGKVADSTVSYFKALRARRPQKLILDLALSFMDEENV